LDGAATILFAVASVVALIVVGDTDPALWWPGWALTLLAVVVPTGLGLAIRARAGQPSVAAD